MTLDFVTDPELVPRPRAEIRITEMSVTPYPDGQRVRIDLAVTPFGPADRPSLEVEAQDPAGRLVGSLSIIETMHRTMSLTMHLRQPEQLRGEYLFRAGLYYDPDQMQHTASRSVVLLADEGESE